MLPELLSNMLSVCTPLTSQHSFLLKLVAPKNISLQGVGREREEREGEEKRRTTCAHARLICVVLEAPPGSISRAASISSRWALIDGAVLAAVAEVQE